MTFLNELTSEDLVYIERNDSLSGLIKSKLNLNGKITRPKDYFYVTELVNPVQAYWDRIDPIEPTAATKKKMLIGNKLHRMVGSWLEGIEGFNYPEAVIDGVWVGIEGVRVFRI